jgi:hypothetical protein
LPVIVGQQTGLPHFLEDAGFHPLLEAIVGSGSGTKARCIQSFPLAAGAQDKENGLHTNPVGSSRLPAAKPMSIYVLRNQQHDGVPQIVRDRPLINYTQLVHVATSVDAAAKK